MYNILCFIYLTKQKHLELFFFMKPFADIHCHPTMHPFAFHEAGKRRKNNLWWDNPPKKCQRKSTFPEYFQTSMPALSRGNVRLVIAALYPLEQPWLNPEFLGTGFVSDIIAKQVVSHLPIPFINKVQSPQFNYFEYLNKEYGYLVKDSGKFHSIKKTPWRYIVAKNAEDIVEYKDDENTVVFVPAIEGAHSLFSGNAKQIIHDPVIHEQTIDNILKVKNWDHPPLYITLSHHFYNGICGQARSIPDGAASVLLEQEVGLNEPINERGERVVDCLLGINEFEGNGRRILIDTKHMSVSTRIWYYDKIKNYNDGVSSDKKIPVIASHMGYGNHKTLLDSIDDPDTDKDKYEDSKIFNPWSINLSDEEVCLIFQSGGIIGLNLDQRILSGEEVIDTSKDFTKRDIRRNRENVVEFWTRQFARNIMGVANAVISNSDIPEDEKGLIWNHIALGSDFDGMINPVDSFIVADEFKNLRAALANYMPQMPQFDHLSMGLTIGEILDKIMYDNAVNFVMKHYC